MREFVVKAPKVALVIVPAVVNNIGVKRLNKILRQALFNLIKRACYIFLGNVKHMVIPGVILSAKVGFLRNGFDIFEKICSDNVKGHCLCASENGFVERMLLFTVKYPCDALSAVITQTQGVFNNVVVVHRKFRACEHTVDINRLSE